MSPESILSRSIALHGSAFRPLQAQVDGLVSRFVEEAANPRTLAAITVGGMAYRMGRLGVMSVGATHASPLRALSMAAGLGSEVTAYEFTNRTLNTFSGGGTPPLQNAWSWSGLGGWREGLMTSAITFGLLKGAGSLAREQNIVLQHAFQSTAMVAGNQVTGLMGITPSPQGALADQLLHAEAVNLQLSAGMSFVHGIAPGLSAQERAFDLELRRMNLPLSFREDLFSDLSPKFGFSTSITRESSLSRRKNPNTFLMVMNGGGEKKDPDEGSPSSVDEMSSASESQNADHPPEAPHDEHLDINIAGSLYRSLPPDVKRVLNIYLMELHETDEKLKDDPLRLLALGLAETLNSQNIALQNRQGSSKENLAESLKIRDWIRNSFDSPLVGPEQEKFIQYYRQALTSNSLPWIHQDLKTIPLCPLSVKAMIYLENIPEKGPYDADLPRLVSDVGEFVGGLHRDGYWAILNHGILNGWIDAHEEGVAFEQIEGFRERYQFNYPQGFPPINQDFLSIYSGTNRLIHSLRDKWGSQHPFMTGIDNALEILGNDPRRAYQRMEFVQRVQHLLTESGREH